MLARTLFLSGSIGLVLVGIAWGLGGDNLLAPVAMVTWSLFALALQATSRFRTFAFSVWVMVFVTAALVYPHLFRTWGAFELKNLMTPLIQLIMFGMGTTLGAADFTRVLAMPKAVLVGFLLQFTIMPLVGMAIAHSFGFPPAVAAGVVLVGSCPGGVASNVMTYLAKGNVALSVTMTACSTLASPLMTPLLMSLLAGQMIEVPFLDMVWSIVNMIIVPIVAGLVANKVLRMLGLAGDWLDSLLSVIAMAAICFIIAIITSLARDQLLGVGLALVGAAVLHNGLGYVLGYAGARLFGLDETTCRTVAIEVGLQNGGMASGLAVNILKSPEAGLAAAIFGPWMNISGSLLASWWRRRPVGQGAMGELAAGAQMTLPVETSS
jgi:BASS family bile acid:Na+ symporter